MRSMRVRLHLERRQHAMCRVSAQLVLQPPRHGVSRVSVRYRHREQGLVSLERLQGHGLRGRRARGLVALLALQQHARRAAVAERFQPLRDR